MDFLIQICNLEYLVLAFIIQHWEFLDIKANYQREHPIIQLKNVYRSLGLLKSEFLEKHSIYWNNLGLHLDELSKEFEHYCKNFNALCEKYTIFWAKQENTC
jgi:hypothetical protein